MDAVVMIEPPGGISGSAAFTAQKREKTCLKDQGKDLWLFFNLFPLHRFLLSQMDAIKSGAKAMMRSTELRRQIVLVAIEVG